MVEHTRAHRRLVDEAVPGARRDLSMGRLFVPEALRRDGSVVLLVHFHGAPWIPETAAARAGDTVSLAVQLGSGSAVYARPFERAGRFSELVGEAEGAAEVQFAGVVVSGWSAGCGAVREVLRDTEGARRVDAAILIDGIHAGYSNGKPGPLESEIETAPLTPLAEFARLAMAGSKRMLVTHSEVFPGTYASTTETADWLLKELGVPRTAVLKWGPAGTQLLSEARSGGFALAGFAGNSAPDHIDHLHALPDFYKFVRKATPADQEQR
jgi:hypothetical protein